MKPCMVAACTRQAKTKQLCGSHYARLLKYGNPLAGGTYDHERTACLVSGCTRKYYGRSYCSMHLRRFKKHGDATAISSRDPRPAMIVGDIAKIPLGAGAKSGYAIVDASNAYIARWKWTYLKCKSGPSYAYRHIYKDGKRTGSITMHRQIMEYFGPLDVEHADRNGLNNRYSNLRVMDRSGNNFNTKPLHVNNSSGHKGISWSKQSNKWRVYIGGSKKRVELGTYDDLGEAVKVRQKAEKYLVPTW